MLLLLAFALLDLGLFALINHRIGIAWLLVAVAGFALEGRLTCSICLRDP